MAGIIVTDGKKVLVTLADGREIDVTGADALYDALEALLKLHTRGTVNIAVLVTSAERHRIDATIEQAREALKQAGRG